MVVGAGLSGLSAALQLAGRGRSVTVVERYPFPGGRMGQADIRGYRIDTGPTVLTMPDIIEDAFAAVGASMDDHLELALVDPAYRATFADGSSLDVHTDAAAMTAAIEQFAGPEQAAGYRRLRDWLTELYKLEMNGFISVQLRLAVVAADPATGAAGRDRRVPRLGAHGQQVHHRRTAATGLHLPGALCGCPAAAARWPPTR